MAVSAVYWSATNTSREIAMRIAARLGGGAQNVAEVNVTRPDAAAHTFTKDDVVVVAVPVFGGRVPPAATQRLARFTGGGARTVAVVVYGNRAFEDALAELTDTLAGCGFQIIAAGAFIAQHSMIPEIAQGRPDDVDLAEIDAFAAEIEGKLARGGTSCPDVPGNRPYKEWKQNKFPIEVSDACTLCRLCALECPMEAIPGDRPDAADIERCVLCMRCVFVCPQRARSVPRDTYERTLGFLREHAPDRREPETFV